MAMTTNQKLRHIKDEVEYIEKYLLLQVLENKPDLTSCYYAGSILVNAFITDSKVAHTAIDFLTQAILTTTKNPIEGEDADETIKYYLKGFKLALETGLVVADAMNQLSEYE